MVLYPLYTQQMYIAKSSYCTQTIPYRIKFYFYLILAMAKIIYVKVKETKILRTFLNSMNSGTQIFLFMGLNSSKWNSIIIVAVVAVWYFVCVCSVFQTQLKYICFSLRLPQFPGMYCTLWTVEWMKNPLKYKNK